MSNKTEVATVPDQSTAVLSMIERVALNSDIPIEKLEKMLDMQERVLDRNAKQQFTADLAAMQVSLPRVAHHGRLEIKKDGRTVQTSSFAKLEDINDAIRPVLQEFGFAVTFRVQHSDGFVWVKTVLSHRGGHSEETSLPVPLDTSGSKNNAQAVGSSISYGKRYGICAMLNISTGDDINGASFEDDHTVIENGGNATGDDRPKGSATDKQLSVLRERMKALDISEESMCAKLRIPKLTHLQPSRIKGALGIVDRYEKSLKDKGVAQ